MRRFPWLAGRARSPRPQPPRRLRLEPLEERTLLSGTAAGLAFDAATGWLTIRGAAGAGVEVAATRQGALAVNVQGRQFLPGTMASALRHVTSDGDALTVKGLETAGDLDVQSKGAVTLAGPVRVAGGLTLTSASLTVTDATTAADLSLHCAGLLDVGPGGSLTARAGGTLTATAEDLVNAGSLRADGYRGGRVALRARDYLNGGVVSASGSEGAGGVVTVAFGRSAIDTSAARIGAWGGAGSGGHVRFAGNGRLFSSGRIDATGTTGGRVDLSGRSVALVAATVDASGTTHGGRVVVQSQAQTDFTGTIETPGGSRGGFIDLSSHGTLTNRGQADAGRGGTLVVDPRNLVISAAPTGVFPQFNLVNPASGGAFGTAVESLSTGNIVVTDPAVNNNTGAVYLFNGQSGALISTLKGDAPGDKVGSDGITVLPSGNFVVCSASWGGGKGALTWVSGTAGLSGSVSDSNSLVGNTPTDQVGRDIGNVVEGFITCVTVLANGNYVAASPYWNRGTGAVTWGSGTTGIVGIVSAGNSLVGSTPGDSVGYSPPFTGVAALSNGNYVVESPIWNATRGAATWGNGTTGTTGTVSGSNSMIGSAPGEEVGATVTALSDGNYVVGSPFWNGGPPNGLGAATWGDGMTGVSGTISAGNSLVGSFSGDDVGAIVIPLSNGNYVVKSPHWNSDEGAATWGDGMTGISGTISASNSLVGSSAFDEVGEIVTALSNGNYVVASPNWNSQSGAVTWGSGTAGITGTVSPSNSLVGTFPGDNLGMDVTALSNGNYVVDSPLWGGGAGAVTWVDGTTGLIGTVSPTNSLVGSVPGDAVGLGATGFGVTALSNGNYVVDSPDWNLRQGAVTWASGSTGITGTVSSGNSLVGSGPDDYVGGGAARGALVNGGVTPLSNGNYAVLSPDWNGQRGAVTWGSGTTGITGPVSDSNSLLGSAAGDLVGGVVTPLSNGDYVVVSPSWNGKRGAATWVDESNGTTLDGRSTIDAQNSLEGAAANGTLDSIQPGTLPGSFVLAVPGRHGGQVVVAVPDANQLTASLGQGQIIRVTPDLLTRSLDTGTAVTAQAGDTLTVGSSISVHAGGHGGALTLEASTLLLDADIGTDGGRLTFSGNVSPGGRKQVLVHLRAAIISFQPHSRYTVQLDGTTAGKGYDQLTVSGVLDLRNPTLHVGSKGHFARGQTFVLVRDSKPITTNFAGLREGGLVSAGGQKLKISYKHDEVTLTVQ